MIYMWLIGYQQMRLTSSYGWFIILCIAPTLLIEHHSNNSLKKSSLQFKGAYVGHGKIHSRQYPTVNIWFLVRAIIILIFKEKNEELK